MLKRVLPPLLLLIAAAAILLLIGIAGALIARAEAAGIPNDMDAVAHALNRLAFGPRPDDVERVRRMGLASWIDRQLQPSKIDDSALEQRLERLARASGANRIGFAAQERFAPQANESAQPFAPDRRDMRRDARAEVEQLAEERLIRAAYSERQLEEVLVDFWFNHFNVFAGKGRTAVYLPEYERDAIRPHVFGRFRDLLEATAKSPAMLFYLDNWMSVDPQTADRRGNANGKRRGLNENYARELLELHTLGVDGGYTQKDVNEVARALTGWTMSLPDRTNPGDEAFRFAPMFHDRGTKVVLGHTIKSGGGIEDGERVLDIVASHPSTARFIATKLARRFISDNPPASLVTRAAARFRETDGNLREVVRAIVTSPEFFAADARQAKVKTPFEFVVSAVRATETEMTGARPLLKALRDLGMPLYGCQPPTGYDDTAETWISSGALVARINVAQQIAGNRAAEIGSPEFQRR